MERIVVIFADGHRWTYLAPSNTSGYDKAHWFGAFPEVAAVFFKDYVYVDFGF